MQYVKSCVGPNKVVVGNGNSLAIKIVGNSKFKSSYEANSHLHLVDILHVPYITKNLILVSKFSKDNKVYFEFHPNTCFVKAQDSNHVLLKGFLDDNGLYYFNKLNAASSMDSLKLKSPKLDLVANNIVYVDQPDNGSLVVSPYINKSALWHARLGHVYAKAMHKVLHMCNVSIINKESFSFFHSCCLGKSHKQYTLVSITK